MKTIRLVALATLAVVMAATCAAADLIFVTKAHGVQTPPPEEPMIADTWQVGMLTEGKWRRDLYETDPAVDADAIKISLIRDDEGERTIILDWEHKQANIITDEDFEKLGEMFESLQEVIKNLPQGMELPAGSIPPQMQAMFSATKPVVNATFEGPLEQGTVAGLACEKWLITIETRDPAGAPPGAWGHTIDTTEAWFANDLDVPESDQDIFNWDPTLHSHLFNEALEEAIGDQATPEGFLVKQRSVTQDLIANTTTVADQEMIGYSNNAIDPQKYEIPEGWTISEVEYDTMPGAEG